MQKWQRPVTWASWVVILWGLAQAKPFVVPMLLAALVSFLMSPLIQFLEKKKIPEWISITLSSLLLFLPVLVVAGLLLSEGSVFIREYPMIEASIKNTLETAAETPFLQKMHLSEYMDLSSITDMLSEDAGKSISVVLTGLRALFEASAHLLIILFFALIMLASRKHLSKSVEKIVGRTRTLDEIITLIEKFLIARIGIAAGVSFLDFLILKGFGSKYSIIFSVFLGFSTFIPAVGFFIGIVPALVTAVALGQEPLSMACMIGLLYSVSSIEAHFVTPKYLGKRLNLNLLVTFMGLFAGELLWGIWGMVLSIPLLGILRIVLGETEDYRHYAELMSERVVPKGTK